MKNKSNGYKKPATRKTTIQQLRESEIFYKHLAELTPEAVVVHQNGIIVYANPTAVRLVAVKSKKELIGQPVMKYVHPDSVPLIQERIKKMLSKRKVAPYIEEKFINSKGEIIIALTKAVPFIFQGKPAILAILHDITKQKKGEERQLFLEKVSLLLGESIEYKTTLKNISKLLVPYLADYMRIVLFDEAGKIEEVAIYHTDPKKISLVKKLYDAYKDRKDTVYGANHVLLTGKSEVIEDVAKQTIAHIKDNQLIRKLIADLQLASYMGIPLLVQKRVIGVITFSSARKELQYTKEDVRFVEEIARRIAYAIENARLYAEAQKAIVLRNDFISLASHELKTPITSLKLYAQTLLTQSVKKGDLSMKAYFEKMGRQTDKLAILVNDLLDISKIQHGKLEFTLEHGDLNAIVEEAVDTVQATTGRHKICIEGRIQRPVAVDHYRIIQVLTNLLTNASKYSPGADSIIVRLSSEKDVAVVTVEDFGIGIEPGQQKKIFQQFYRVENPEERTFPGLGMGLFIANEIVKRHGGSMHVVSQKGKGSQFSFTLPYVHMISLS